MGKKHLAKPRIMCNVLCAATTHIIVASISIRLQDHARGTYAAYVALTIRPSGISTAPDARTRGCCPDATAASSASDRSSACRAGRTKMTSLIARPTRQPPASIHDMTGNCLMLIASRNCCHLRDAMRGRWLEGARLFDGERDGRSRALARAPPCLALARVHARTKVSSERGERPWRVFYKPAPLDSRTDRHEV